MRIIGGRLRGRVLPGRALSNVRPTTDRARETVFNILQNYVEFTGARVLDLFAGSGALGFEAVSRGAESAVFVEKHRKTAEMLDASAHALGVEHEVQVVRDDVLRFLATPQSVPYRLVFCDPPYALTTGNRVFALLAAHKWCEPGAVLVSEHDMRETVLEQPGWRKVAERMFGETKVDFFQHSSEAV